MPRESKTGKRYRVNATIREVTNEPHRRRREKNSNTALIIIIVLVLLGLLWSRQRQVNRPVIPQTITAPR
jgi:hypothetical protein